MVGVQRLNIGLHKNTREETVENWRMGDHRVWWFELTLADNVECNLEAAQYRGTLGENAQKLVVTCTST
jgi:hypothetical protein